MATHSLDPVVFRQLFPEFANETTYPDVRIQLFWDLGAGFIGSADGLLLYGAQLQAALDYMAAHLLKTAVIAASGQGASGVTLGAMIDKISVTLAAPPFRSGWDFWLSTTPYGATLWALLSMASAGGLYVGGSLERAAFRKVGGRF